MSKRPLAILPAILLFVAAGAACGDSDDNGLVAISRIDFNAEDHLLNVFGDVVPPVPHNYPDIVARVNGEELTGDELMERQVALDQSQQEFAKTAEQARLTDEELAPLMVQFEEADPLELLIEDALLRQAVAREGTLPSQEEAKELVRLNEANIIDGFERMANEDRADFEIAIRQLGYPESDWASDERIVDHFRWQAGLSRLREQVCDGPAGSIEQIDAVRGSPDCTAFLAAERAAADIEVYVRWVD